VILFDDADALSRAICDDGDVDELFERDETQ
jgi:hypothetical protein